MESNELYRHLLGINEPWTVERVDLDMAQGAILVGATAIAEGRHQGGKTGNHIGSRPLGLPHHINGDGAQLTKRHIQAEAAKIFVYRVANHFFRIGGKSFSNQRSLSGSHRR